MFFLDILRDKYNFKLIKGRHLDYSTMVIDGIYGEYFNGDKFIYWGLNEFKKPPTLISPRPKITKSVTKTFSNFKTKVQYNVTFNDCERSDDLMNECLSKFNHDDIINAILNPELNLLFNLNTNSIETI